MMHDDPLSLETAVSNIDYFTNIQWRPRTGRAPGRMGCDDETGRRAPLHTRCEVHPSWAGFPSDPAWLVYPVLWTVSSRASNRN